MPVSEMEQREIELHCGYQKTVKADIRRSSHVKL